MTAKSPRYAPARADGLKPYVWALTSFGRTDYEIKWAASLHDAKARHGWSGMRYTTVHIRRATPADMEAYDK